jgi:hypothetical protein
MLIKIGTEMQLSLHCYGSKIKELKIGWAFNMGG